mgnify:FL=1
MKTQGDRLGGKLQLEVCLAVPYTVYDNKY